MNFFTWLTTKRKTLATMTLTELRAQEMMLENERNRMQTRVTKLAREKQQIIDRGAKEKTPELRRTFAQQYDLLHTEQMMLARHLNIRSKEYLTVARLRMLRENTQRAGVGTSARTLIREGDLAVIERLIENDRVSTEVYQERLDEILRLGQEADEATAGVSPAAGELLKIWNDMDAGLIKDTDAAFDEAERRVREREKAADA
ncbi:MAG: hypothetical protein PVJ57_17090 [Phycisphaerae bacterium]|jgi:hypothetical protein